MKILFLLLLLLLFLLLRSYLKVHPRPHKVLHRNEWVKEDRPSATLGTLIQRYRGLWGWQQPGNYQHACNFFLAFVWQKKELIKRLWVSNHGAEDQSAPSKTRKRRKHCDRYKIHLVVFVEITPKRRGSLHHAQAPPRQEKHLTVVGIQPFCRRWQRLEPIFVRCLLLLHRRFPHIFCTSPAIVVHGHLSPYSLSCRYLLWAFDHEQVRQQRRAAVTSEWSSKFLLPKILLQNRHILFVPHDAALATYWREMYEAFFAMDCSVRFWPFLSFCLNDDGRWWYFHEGVRYCLCIFACQFMAYAEKRHLSPSTYPSTNDRYWKFSAMSWPTNKFVHILRKRRKKNKKWLLFTATYC